MIAKVALASVNGSGVSGTATFADASGGVEIELGVRSLPDPGATYLAHVHPGSCAGEPAGGDREHTQDHHSATDAHDHHLGSAEEPGGGIEYPLTPIVPNPDGGGSSNTLIKGVTIARLFSDREFYVNVHAETTGSKELPDSVACGNLQRSS